MIQINLIFRIRLSEMDHMEDILRNISSARYVKLIKRTGKLEKRYVFLLSKILQEKTNITYFSQGNAYFHKIDTLPPALRKKCK